MGPGQAGRKCDGRIFGRDGWRIVDAGMVAGTCHKLDDERSLRTVVVIGVSCDGCIFGRDDRPAGNAMAAFSAAISRGP